VNICGVSESKEAILDSTDIKGKPEVDVKTILWEIDKGWSGGETSTTTLSLNLIPENHILPYLNVITNTLLQSNNFNPGTWKNLLFCESVFRLNISHIETLREKAKSLVQLPEDPVFTFNDSDDEIPDLYKGSFSLAYGTRTLLRDAKMHLKRGKFYCLLGPNNCGKSTLMKTISEEKLEGFPKRNELVTIYVKHGLDAERQVMHEDGVTIGKSEKWPCGRTCLDLNGVEYVVDVVNHVYKKSPPITYEMAEEELTKIGFKNIDQNKNLESPADIKQLTHRYSGGWQVKMQLCCAILIDADILLVDDPTGHLDTKNQEFVKDWLRNFLKDGGSVCAASPDVVFMNELGSHILEFQEKRLRQFKKKETTKENTTTCEGGGGGVLDQYVKAFPDKEHYLKKLEEGQREGSNNDISTTPENEHEATKPFQFPNPDRLEGVNSRSKKIIKMTDVTFRYPTNDFDTLHKVNLSVCMASRIAVVGGNGAGKSTAIKLLIGDTEVDSFDPANGRGSGSIWKQRDLRVGYVPQHAKSLLDNHKDKTAVQYILWRFAGTKKP